MFGSSKKEIFETQGIKSEKNKTAKMASGDNFYKTLTIEGEYDQSNIFRKFKEPLVYFRLPGIQNNTKKVPRASKAAPAARRRLRAGSAPPSMGRKKLSHQATHDSDAESDPDSTCGQVSPLGTSSWRREVSRCGMKLFSTIWLPVCFLGINAVCYAIDPAAAALMMSSTSFLLYQMGVTGREVTLLAILIGCAALIMHGSDVVYVMVVHTLYYCAVSLRSNANALSAKEQRKGNTKRAA